MLLILWMRGKNLLRKFTLAPNSYNKFMILIYLHYFLEKLLVFSGENSL